MLQFHLLKVAYLRHFQQSTIVCSRPSTRKIKLKEILIYEKKEKQSAYCFWYSQQLIAAIYVVLTIVFAPISFRTDSVSYRRSTDHPPPPSLRLQFPDSLWDVRSGNILGGAILPDIIVGSMATLLGAIFTYLLRNRSKWLAPLPPIIANTVLIPFVLYYGYQILLPIPFQMLTVGIGEVLSCGILGMIVYTALNKYKTVIFRQ